MKAKDWFIVGLRLIGVWLMVSSSLYALVFAVERHF